MDSPKNCCFIHQRAWQACLHCALQEIKNSFLLRTSVIWFGKVYNYHGENETENEYKEIQSDFYRDPRNRKTWSILGNHLGWLVLILVKEPTKYYI
jgi:hypothetical protein